MTRAVRLISTWGVDALGLTRITWYAVAGNEASRHVAEASGYVVEGLLRRGESRRYGRLSSQAPRPCVAARASSTRTSSTKIAG